MELLGYVAPVSSCIFDMSVKLDEQVVKKNVCKSWQSWEEKTAKASFRWNWLQKILELWQILISSNKKQNKKWIIVG